MRSKQLWKSSRRRAPKATFVDFHRLRQFQQAVFLRAWRDAREGAYLLRTNLKEERTEELWKKYIQLTEAEAVFRALKANWPSDPSSIRKSSA